MSEKTLHQGRCKEDLYPLESHSSEVSSHKVMVSINHPAFPIVDRVLKNNKLPFSGHKIVILFVMLVKWLKTISSLTLNQIVYLCVVSLLVGTHTMQWQIQARAPPGSAILHTGVSSFVEQC